MKKKKMNKSIRGQGAIEYLLLLVAAVVVVLIVMNFLTSAAGPAQDTGNTGTFEYICDLLDSNTKDCACYNQNLNDYFATGSGENGDGDTYCCTTNTNNFLKEKWGCS